MITTACDMVVFCIQQQEDEEQARREAASWAKEVVASCGEFLSGHLRKQVNIFFLYCISLFMFKILLMKLGNCLSGRGGAFGPCNLYSGMLRPSRPQGSKQETFPHAPARRFPARERSRCAHRVVPGAVTGPDS